MTGLPAPPQRRALQTALLAAAVLAVVIGVVAMHSLGMGHQGMRLAGPAHSMAAPSPHPAAPASFATMRDMAVSPGADGCTSCPVATDQASHQSGSDGIQGMCLAVLPILLLMLTRSLAGRRSLGPAFLLRGRRQSMPAISRDPPLHLRPSMWKLCVLRT